ncbi:MucR family transcriptional regulator [Methylocystis parvus]|uniref:MucR family transcriptional regulator n=1 Tax=Methylocystis parvus TaxID=134 RepID=UPI003C788402
MSEIDGAESLNSTELAAEIVAAFVSHNSLPVMDLPGLGAALRGLISGAPTTSASEKRTPAVPIKKSVTPDHLVCLDDRKKFKSLRRHLATLGRAPEEYRAKWGLQNAVANPKLDRPVARRATAANWRAPSRRSASSSLASTGSLARLATS